MRVTERDLMVARAVRDQCEFSWRQSYEDAVLPDENLAEIIESLPDPAELVKYGCHCDIENTVSGEPDECVFDNGDIEDCVYATQLQREDKGKLQCKYWKPVSRPEPAEPEQAAETERFARIGKLFCELWEAGAPWPVRHWSCDKHKVKGCLRCKTTTAPMVVP